MAFRLRDPWSIAAVFAAAQRMSIEGKAATALYSIFYFVRHEAAKEMREGPSGSDGRIRAQTTGSCFGTMAGVVSVSGKSGTKPVR